jgi:hypothetical protein
MQAAGIPRTDIAASMLPNILVVQDLYEKIAKHDIANQIGKDKIQPNHWNHNLS